MEKKTVTRKDAPATDLPYSPAILYGSLVFVSGQVPIDPGTGAINSQDFTEQVEMVMKNLDAILREAGSSMEKIIKTTVFLRSMENFGKLNEIFKQYFPNDRPARSCVEVSRLPFEAEVEIEAIAYV